LARESDPASIGRFPNGLPVAFLYSAPAFLQPKSFWDIWGLSDSLSSRVALNFQWGPGHAGLSGNERADSLAKTGATLSVSHVPCPLAPLELALPRLIRCNCPDFAATVTDFSCPLTYAG